MASQFFSAQTQLVIFNGTTQLEDPLVYVEGVPFLVIFNDTHWNNTFAYRAFLQVLVQFFPSCCDSKKCSSHLLISDRFSGHDSPETAALLEEHRICPIVVEDTTRGAPNDFCFNHLIRTTFDNTQLQIHQDRAKANALRERDGLPPHPNLTLDQKRQLALYVLRHVAFDLSDMFRRSFDTRSSDFINTPQCQSR
jgi:hypothetical protein